MSSSAVSLRLWLPFDPGTLMIVNLTIKNKTAGDCDVRSTDHLVKFAVFYNLQLRNVSERHGFSRGAGR